MRPFILGILLAAGLAGECRPAETIEPPSKADLDALFAQRRYEEAVPAYRRYLQAHPEDLPAALAFASLLSELRQHQEAARVLEGLLQKHPEHTAAAFKLGVEYVVLQRVDEAKGIFEKLAQSSNPDQAGAAADALRTLHQDAARAARLKQEEKVFQLAAQAQPRQVLEAIAELEKAGPLSWSLEMQRLYAWQSLNLFTNALQRADQLALTQPTDPEFGLLRAELLLQNGRRPEALDLWRQVCQKYPGTPAAERANRRLAEVTRQQADERIYELAGRQQHREVVAAVEAMEKEGGGLSLTLELQRLYALQALKDYAGGLVRAEQLGAKYPQSADLALLRADFLAGSGKAAEAQQVLRRIIQQHPDTPAAIEAAKRLRDMAPTATPSPPPSAPATDEKAEARIYELAAKQQHREVVTAIDELEKRLPLSWPIELQRLYAWQSLGETNRALQRAEHLALSHPQDAQLGLVRAELLLQNGRRAEALAVWRQVTQAQPESPAAKQASQRIAEVTRQQAEERVYELAARSQHREVVAAVESIEQERDELPLPLELQRLYSLQALGRKQEAVKLADKLSVVHTNSTELALLRADLLISARDWKQAVELLRGLKHDHAGTRVAAQAEDRLELIPPVANPDKWSWGEGYASGDYYGWWDSLVGSGFIRSGTYIPGARWLQPYAQMQFGVDTKSDVTGQPTIIEDNHVGFYGGIRLQPFATEYLFLYVMAGTDKDLLDQRAGGDWVFDYQAGIYGFKGWGPGMNLFREPKAEVASGLQGAAASEPGSAKRADSVFWRSDWFADVGADFSYYDRYSSWLGYAQARQGLRFLQLGPHAALDAYVVENLGWDVRGNYYDNFVSLGPGTRLIWSPHPSWQVVLRAEWINGFYFGRDELNNRGSASSQYDGLHAGLSVGMRW